MSRLVLSALVFAGSCAFASETRSGWYVNMTPANATLIDKDGEWTIDVQGGYQAPGSDDLSVMSNPDEVVLNNGVHGYSCASLEVDVNPKTKMVTKVISGKQLLLKACLEDVALPSLK